LVSEMSNPGSSSFAPKRSQGAAPGINARHFDVEQVVLPPKSPETVRQFANNVPSSLRRAQIPQPRLAPELPARTPAARAEKRMVQSLELAHQALEKSMPTSGVNNSNNMSNTLKGSMQLTGGGTSLNQSGMMSPGKPGAMANTGGVGVGGAELPSWFSKPTADRPVTPRVPDAATDPETLAAEEIAKALRLLQRLLRGRAAQNAMYVGRAARAELISELRTATAPRSDGGKRIEAEEAALDTMAGGKVAAILAESTTELNNQ
jgi:hypothetical protein